MYEIPICILCRGCRRRSLLAPDRLPVSPAHLSRLELRCSACGSREVTKLVLSTGADAERFLKGEEVRPVRAVR